MNAKIKTIIIILLISITGLFAQKNCLEFDGTEDYVAIPDLTLTEYTSITIEAWVYPHSFNPQSPDNYISNVVGHDDASALLRIGDEDASHMQENDRAQFAVVTQNGVDKCNAITEMNTNTWYHIAGTYDGSNLRIYVNGILEDTEPHTGYISTSETSIHIGGPNASSRLFDGLMDEVRIWNTSRTQTEIRQNMFKEITGSESGLLAYYKLNESDGTSIAADSKGSNDGTLTNMTGNEWQTSPAMFGPKNCLDFDGTDDYVEVADDPSLYQNNTITVSAWIYPRNITVDMGWKRIIEKNSWIKDGWTFFHSHFYNPELHVDIDGDNVNSEQIITENQWQHIAFTYNSTHLKIYYNGEEVYSAEKNYTLYSANPLSIGHANGAGDYFNGIIDEVCIWNTALTAHQIRENMCKTLTGSENGLIAYYNFDNTSGTTLQDFSGNENDGTLTLMDPATDWVSSSAFNTWLNTDNSTWSTASNWSDSVPVSTDNVGVYSYSGGTNAVLSGSPTVNNMVLGQSSSMTLSSGVTVDGSLILESNLDLNGQTITLGSSATLVEDAGLFSGSSGSITITRLLNNIDEDVAGLGAEITTSSDMGSTVITRQHAPAGSQAIERRYEINPTNNSGLNATLVFHYDDSELNGHDESTLELFKSSDGSSWTEQTASTVNTTENTLTLTGISDFSHWTAAPQGSDQSLPVELISFIANAGDGAVTLKWKTASELNNDAFILERSTDNETFEILAEIDGQGSTSSETKYSFTDNSVFNGFTYYYRLADRGINGMITYHTTVNATPNSQKVDFEQTGQIVEKFALHSNYPNPFNPETTIKFAVPTANSELHNIKLNIYNSLGQLITTLYDGQVSGGQYEMKWNAANQPSGVYFLTFQSEQFVKTEKLILLR